MRFLCEISGTNIAGKRPSLPQVTAMSGRVQLERGVGLENCATDLTLELGILVDLTVVIFIYWRFHYYRIRIGGIIYLENFGKKITI
jgi:hypothetical protein